MFVYLRNDQEVKRVCNVVLEKCFRPSVGTFVEERIEPALWYKVLVLDSVFVDCNHRNVYWNIQRSAEADLLHKIESHELSGQKVYEFFKGKERIFVDAQCYDFHPTIDELFDTTKNIIEHLNPEVIDREGNSLVCDEVLKLLHVFILPEISFREKDKSHVQAVLAEIEKQQDKVEDEIQAKDRTKRNTENSLWKQRQDLIRTEDFSSAKYVSSLDETFLDVLLKHIEKDLVKLNEIFLKTDEQIRPLRNSTNEKDVKKLTKARDEQIEIFKVIEKFTVAREEIKNVLHRSHIKKSFRKTRTHLTDFHLIYVEVNRRLEKIFADLWELINRKIKLSGVREAANQTLREIETDGLSFGYNRKKGTFEKEVDLFDPSNKPEAWATLSEKVKNCLSAKQFGFRMDYEKFCQMVKNKVLQIQNESRLFSGEPVEPLSPGTVDIINRMADESISRRSDHLRRHDQSSTATVTFMRQRSYSSSRWSISPASQSASESICKEICEHIAEMSRRLALELKGNSREQICRSYVSKVYVCYEQHVSEELMSLICELFEENYRPQCESLHQWISNFSSELGMESVIDSLITSSPISSTVDSVDILLDTGIEIPSQHVKEATPQSQTCYSRDFMDMPMDELYERMNKQHQSVDDDFVGALEIDANPEAELDTDVGAGLETELQGSPKQEFINQLQSSAGSSNESPEKLLVQNNQQPSGSQDPDFDSLEDLIAKEDTVVTMMPNINGCKLDDLCDTNSDIDAGSVEVILRSRTRNTPSIIPPKSQQFYDAFDKFFQYVEEEDQAKSLFSKLAVLTKAVKYIGNQISKLRDKGIAGAPCTDDLLDVSIVLLCKLDCRSFLKLYAHMNVMIQLFPHFMQGNAHEYSLTQLSMAYQFLFEQKVLQNNNHVKQQMAKSS